MSLKPGGIFGGTIKFEKHEAKHPCGFQSFI
jgi:hypothetical protein